MNLKEYIRSCPCCGCETNSWGIGNYLGTYVNQKTGRKSTRFFCDIECYCKYKKRFEVEIYNGQPIYCVEIFGESRYLPYFEASYYFTDIDACKQRIDMKNSAYIPMSHFHI